MARVMYCTMEQQELDTAIRIAEQLQVDMLPYLVEKDDAAHCQKLVTDAYEGNVDAILCRGRIRAFLRDIRCTIPIVPNYFSGKETMSILWNIRKYYRERGEEDPSRKVCLLTHQPLFINERIYSQVFEMEVHNVVIPQDSLTRMEPFLRKIQAEGYDCVACGRSIKPIADRIGLVAFCDFHEMAEDAISDGLRTAAVVAASTAEMKTSVQNLRTMMDNAFEAILLLDGEGRITLLNQRAELRLNRERRIMVGEYIWNVIPQIAETDIRNVLETGRNIFGTIVQIEDFSAMVNVSAVQSRNGNGGAIVQFTELQRIEQMSEVVRKELYSKGHVAKYTFESIVGESPGVQEAKRFAAQFAKYHSNVLILGETGIGKELFAQSIHNASLRSGKPFVAINCGAIPQNLLESELFGYVDGAFTGASRRGKKGLFEIADGGTIFLDEISEMDLGEQVQLLRVLEERVIHKVGDDKMIPIDVRVIAASNRNLRQAVEEGKFREDLYYRLNVLTLNLPPLRERGRDVILLANYFFKSHGKKYRKLVSLSPEAEAVLCSYNWPGNIRQLRNFCEKLVAVANSSILEGDFVAKQLAQSFMLLPEETQPEAGKLQESGEAEREKSQEDSQTEDAAPEENDEKKRILAALNRSQGNRKAAAEVLGISKSTLWRKMKKYEIGEKF
ncbi:MAG: sigma 54-interacting transcriptional regulator [Lachnospiraceae bacterium]|nr:sigma 54-interacting transcriptional regulator [Lachnospiraceae bacterium]